MRMLVTMLLLILSVSTLKAAEVVVTFETEAQSELYHALLKEYRCLKCQNQNLADSNAGLAGDLRREIRDQILAGNDKTEIDQYLIARYGDFVLYRPPFNAKTALLWIGPFVLLGLALLSVLIMIRKQRKSNSETDSLETNLDELSKQKLERAKQLLRK